MAKIGKCVVVNTFDEVLVKIPVIKKLITFLHVSAPVSLTLSDSVEKQLFLLFQLKVSEN